MCSTHSVTGARLRPCCESTYDSDHFNECPELGVEARAAKPCDYTSPDGWCMTHSTGAGPVYFCGMTT